MWHLSIPGRWAQAVPQLTAFTAALPGAVKHGAEMKDPYPGSEFLFLVTSHT